jgi:hypothetical protein
MDKRRGDCEHLNTKLFTRNGADHVGVDLFARCQDCGFEGIDFPHIECWPNEITPEMRRKVLDAFDKDAITVRATQSGEG